MPRLQVKALFATGVDPGPHIGPLATVIAAARGTCFSATAPLDAVAAASLGVATRQIHVKSNNVWGKCVAAALDGHAIDDAATYDVDVELVISATGSNSP